MSVGVIVAVVVAVLVSAILVCVCVVVAVGMAMGVRMLVVVVVVVRNCSFAAPRARELPDGNRADGREYQKGNPSKQHPDEEHRREDSGNHSSLVHQNGDQADGPAHEDREKLVEEVCPLAFAVSMSMGMSHFAPSLSAG